MSKEELIKYCVNNNYTFTETPSEIRVDKIIDKLENIVFAFAYYKEDKSIKFFSGEQGDKEFSEVEYTIFINLKNVGDKE